MIHIFLKRYCLLTLLLFFVLNVNENFIMKYWIECLFFLTLILGGNFTPPPPLLDFPSWLRKLKFGIPNSPQSTDIGRNVDEGIPDFRISGQSLINENCHNSRTSLNTDMKPGPVTKFDKTKLTSCRKILAPLSFF